MSGIFRFLNNKKFLKSNIDEHLRINFSFYKYFYIKDKIYIKNKIKKFFKKLEIFGRIYISSEGINVQANVLKKFFYIMKKFIYNLHLDLNNVFINIGIDNFKQSFFSLVIKIKKRIVNDNLKLSLLNSNYYPKYLDSKSVNKYLNNKNVIFIDIRNNYEYKIGHFKNSISINTKTFRSQLSNLFRYIKNYKKKKIVIYCTGGIRCEKTAFLMYKKGYKKVYQIYGGIIGYVNDCKKNNNPVNFLGKNFVFDFRLKENITQEILSNCYHCSNKSDYYLNCMNEKCNLLFIQCLICSKKYKSFCSEKCLIKNN
ncbi:MAG: rhodanese-related sulfurtransferase [Buchnera aphidicola (Periphyllus lyropictus)]|uniref:oxygen-dependent tRNA uridine(34) hydroxylase TrhO n=1 Tax=Buchnera aphidicola TaxID=9 RepID=UPI001EB9E94A|nr:rhodanese-related sulfurtransferase [Buchnera aphidicola]NIH16585.1 rhodanese-related sulfurtransferase [Buchnera aphidicola (Periphyllus lyropictus)]USS94475.1 rhodanese-related sulfurtransferase [Buchnera aphidicola (Periphyllus lyropictus)]